MIGSWPMRRKAAARLGSARWYANWLALKRNPLAVSGVIIVLALILMAIFAIGLPAQSPYAQLLTARLEAPSMSALVRHR